MATGRIHLGLAEREFWLLTPREYRSLADAYEAAQVRLDGRFGVLAELVAGAAGWKREGGGAMEAADYFPSLRQPAKATAPDTRPAAIALEDSIAEGWLAWSRKANEVAAALGQAPD
jgi:hypothetical protein